MCGVWLPLGCTCVCVSLCMCACARMHARMFSLSMLGPKQNARFAFWSVPSFWAYVRGQQADGVAVLCGCSQCTTPSLRLIWTLLTVRRSWNPCMLAHTTWSTMAMRSEVCVCLEKFSLCRHWHHAPESIPTSSSSNLASMLVAAVV